MGEAERDEIGERSESEVPNPGSPQVQIQASPRLASSHTALTVRAKDGRWKTVIRYFAEAMWGSDDAEL